jgi:hypothetical protein
MISTLLRVVALTGLLWVPHTLGADSGKQEAQGTGRKRHHVARCNTLGCAKWPNLLDSGGSGDGGWLTGPRAYEANPISGRGEFELA